MLQKLQKKFVFINMSLVSFVLIVAFTSICLFRYTEMKQDWHSILVDTAMMKEEPGPHRFPFDNKMNINSQENAQPPKQPGNGEQQPLRDIQGPRLYNAISFSVSIDADGKVVSKLGKDVDISQELLTEIVTQAIEKSDELKEGNLPEYDLRYLFMESSDNHSSRTIAFLDISNQKEDFKNLILTLFLVGMIGETAFLLISILLARIALKPVRLAWEHQRQFVADASHELKTPITVILANTGILLGHTDDTIGKHEKWLAYIKEEAERMKKLVEDMLFLAKADTEKLPMEKLNVNFSDLLQNSLLTFESVAFENGISLEQDISPDIAVNGNEGQLHQLITILIDNACKYTPAGGKVSVSLVQKQEKIYFAVKNTGSYIPKEERERIFERFYRVDESRARKEGGYGLGLAIANGIVKAHKWKMTVISKKEESVNQGIDSKETTFQVQF